MDSMIERVARAIAQNEDGDGGTWESYADMARDAIEAMREPTEAMYGAAQCDDWQAMIDAALMEGK